VFTNQGGLAAGFVTVQDLDHKFNEIQKAVNVPMVFLASTGSTKMKVNPYRKPAKGLFELIKDEI